MENFLNTSTILSSGIINTDILETNLINIAILTRISAICWCALVTSLMKAKNS